MRFIFSLFLFVSWELCLSQAIPKEDNLYVYSDVVIADSASSEFLYKNATNWLTQPENKTLNLTITKDSIAGKLSGHASFLVYSQTGVLAKISGRVTYDFVIEVKPAKYRYTFDNFIFHYYKQDRNYKLVETSSIKPLTEKKATGWQKLWDQHRKTTDKRIQADVKDLKEKINFKPEKPKPKEKKVEW